jgi:hypothetical protein
MRILIGVLFPSAVLGVWLYARSGSTAIYCIFFKLTGLYCPGCGSTRAIRAAFNGRLWEAFLCNPLVFVLGIPSLGIVIYEYFRLVFPRLNLKPTILPRKLESFLVILIFVFWILRNIPVFSFLAPG